MLYRLLALSILAGAYAVCGCSKQSNGHPGGGSASTSAPLTTYTPTGPFPRGQVNPANLPARQGPAVQVVSPPRGSQVTLPTVDVEVEALDADGVTSVTIGGVPAAARGGARYGATVGLLEGLNVVEVAAVDGLGDRSTGAVALVRGRFAPPGTLVPASARVMLDQDALDAVRRDVEARLGTLNLLALIHAAGRPILNTALVDADVTAVGHAPPRVPTLTAGAGAITAAVEVDTLRVEVDVDIIGTGQVFATADRARIEVHAAIRPPTGPSSGARLLGLEVDRVDLTFTNLRLQARSGLANLLLAPFQGLIRNAIQSALERALRNAITTALARPMAGVDTPMLVNVPTPTGPRPVELLGRVDTGRGWPGVGLDLEAGVSVTAPQPYPHALTADVLVVGPPAPALTWAATDDVGVVLSVDGLDAFAHAYWRAGGGRVVLDGTQPTTGRPLAARVLYPFFPIARDLAPDPLTPVVIEVSLEAPPMLRLGAPANAVTLQLPEAQVSIAFDHMDGGPRVELLRARLTVEGTVDVAVSGQELVLSNLRAARLGADVIAEPAGDLDDQGVEAFLVHALPTVVGALRLPRIPIPALPQGLTLVAPSVEARDGWLIVRAGVR